MEPLLMIVILLGVAIVGLTVVALRGGKGRDRFRI